MKGITNVRIYDDIYTRIKQLAEEEGYTTTDYINLELTQYLCSRVHSDQMVWQARAHHWRKRKRAKKSLPALDTRDPTHGKLLASNTQDSQGRR